MEEGPPSSPAPEPTRVDRLRLVLLSFLMLFVELALIRWTGSNVVYLSYFSNFVLLGSFLGIGAGFLRSKSRVDLFPWAPLALSLLVAFVSLFPVKLDRSGSDLIFFGELRTTGAPIWVVLPLLFVAVAGVMAMIAEGVGRQFAKFPPLEAYRFDIVGSILGIAAFSLLAFLHAPPIVWGLVAALVFVALLRPIPRRALPLARAAALVVLLGFLANESLAPSDSWSPYYKVHTVDLGPDVTDVWVNGIPHQRIESTQTRRSQEPFYFTPYDNRADPGPPGDVLIVGAGTGSDVAIALSQGVGHVDAVEIDPRLQDLGAQRHPDRPYDDPRVSVTINDGRAFLQGTSNAYDLILFALPDSLTLVSGQSSLRLESYLFTLEAIQAARDHLKPNGSFAMYNYYREGWLVDRLASTLGEAYGHAPCIDLVERPPSGLAVLQVSPDPADLDCPERWTPLAAPVAPAARDDRPFLYLRHREMPQLYLVTIALILAASLALVRVVAGRFGGMRGHLDLFAMGAAFLLLETKNIVQFALLFGTTWFVNALVFGGILLTVLAAIEVSRRIRIRRLDVVYGVLLISLVAAWLVPSASLLALAPPLRFGAATALAFAPVFLANLVFAERFRETENPRGAFGSNLLGAMVGGLLEYSALLVGYRALLILTGLLYGIAFLAGRRAVRGA